MLTATKKLIKKDLIERSLIRKNKLIVTFLE